MMLGGLCLKSCTDLGVSGGSDVDLDLELIRFEQALFQVDSTAQVLELSSRFPAFYPIYAAQLGPIGWRPGMSDMDMAIELYSFVTLKDFQWLYAQVQERYGNMEKIRSAFEQAAERIVHYFPEDSIERLYTYIGNFDYAGAYLPLDKKAFCVGLEMYMGSDFEVYPQLPANRFPGYRIKRFEERFMLANALMGYMEQKVEPPQRASFIEEAIYEGKKLYALDLLLPDAHDSIRIGYLDGMIEWCEDNAENIWAYLVEQDLLFSTDRQEFVQKFFHDGPFTTPFGAESAPRVGAWVGWQIVRRYMERKTDVSLEALLMDSDFQTIFNESRYKP